MTTHLYEIAGVREVLDGVIAENDGVLDASLEAALDAIDLAFEEKAERVALYIRERLALAAAIREEEERLAARRKALTGTAEHLTGYLQQNMERVGKTRINGLLATVSLQKNPPKVEALTPLDEAELRNIASFAPRYVKHEESWALDKRAILDDAKAGTLDPEVGKRVAITQSVSLRIR